MGNKEKLITCAVPMMARDGYAATSMDVVIAAAHIAKSNAYYHFPTKEHLGHEVLEHIVSAFLELTHITLQNSALSFQQQGASYLSRLLMFQQAMGYPGDCITVLATEINSSRSRELFMLYQTATLSSYEQWLKNNNHTIRLNTLSVASILFYSLEGAYIQARMKKSNEPLEATFRILYSSL